MDGYKSEQENIAGHIGMEEAPIVAPERRIQDFILKNQILSLATSVNNVPYCCNIFYAYDPLQCKIYFMSSPETKHIHDALINAQVAGTITSPSNNISKLQGIQFTGFFSDTSSLEDASAQSIYFKKFPFARVMKSDLWSIRIDFIKMTDNTLGFGKKISWSRY